MIDHIIRCIVWYVQNWEIELYILAPSIAFVFLACVLAWRLDKMLHP